MLPVTIGAYRSQRIYETLAQEGITVGQRSSVCPVVPAS